MEIMTSSYCLPSDNEWKVELIVTVAQMECLAKFECCLKETGEGE
jgi:hypothetical protein